MNDFSFARSVVVVSVRGLIWSFILGFIAGLGFSFVRSAVVVLVVSRI